jgi:hypothetical protein
MCAGRHRWRIENEVFNTLKNQGYNLEHNFLFDGEHLSAIVDSDRCLFGFPHPSGANGHRKKHFEERKEELSERVKGWFGKTEKVVFPQFKLEKNRWYSFQMFPGYGDGFCPYYSPILLKGYEKDDPASNVYIVEFINICYVQGVRDFSVKIMVKKQTENYLFGEIVHEYSKPGDRSIVLGDINYEWLMHSGCLSGGIDKKLKSQCRDVSDYLWAILRNSGNRN